MSGDADGRGRARRRARALALPCVLAALAPGCVAPGTDYEALPFYREDRTTPGIVRHDVPLALLTLDRVAAGATAPVVSAVPHRELPQREERGGYVLRFPWPLGTWVGDGRHHNFLLTGLLGGEGLATAGPLGRALSSDAAVREDVLAAFAQDPEAGGVGSVPFVFYDQQVDHDDLPDLGERTDVDRDVGLLPLFAWGGGDREGEGYLALAPFGGVTRGLLGKEEITWFGFPYPLYARVEDRSYTSHHVLWPFVNWLEGPRNSGFRVFPFYGSYARKGLRGQPIYERTWLLWPFLTFASDGLDDPGGSTESFMAFPFYGRVAGPDRDVWSVLFPFFKYEDDRARETWDLRAPFPFLMVGGGRDRWRFDLWPFFGLKERPGFARQFLLWPLGRHESMETADVSFSGVWALPLFWRTRWLRKADGAEKSNTRVYPLLHARAERDGSLEVAGLSPLWLDDPGFERTLGTLLRLYRYRRDADGGTEHQALLGLVSWRDLPARPGRAEYSRLSLLFGMVQVRSLGDEGGLRLLWLLPELTWGGGAS